METPSMVIKEFYEFCVQCIAPIKDRPKLGKLIGEVFTFEQAFWIHFVSIALSSWDEDSEYEIKLSEVFSVFLTIYRNEVVRDMSFEDEFNFIKTLKDKYETANKIWRELDDQKSLRDLARLALGEDIDITRLTLAATDIPASLGSFTPLPWKLTEDI